MRIGGRGAPVRCMQCHRVHGSGMPCPKVPTIEEALADLERWLRDYEQFQNRPVKSTFVIGQHV